MVLKQIMRSAAKKADKAISSAAKVGLKVNKAIDNASLNKMKSAKLAATRAVAKAKLPQWPVSSKLANNTAKNTVNNYKRIRWEDIKVAEMAHKINKILSKYAK